MSTEGIPAERMKNSDFKSDFFFHKNQWIKLLIQALEVNLDLHLQPQKISRTIKYAPEKASIRKTPKNNSELKDSGLKDSELKIASYLLLFFQLIINIQ
jgi:hypothetical protein